MEQEMMEQEEEPERPAAQTPMPPQEAGSMGIEEEDIEEEEEEELEAPSPVDVKACFVLPSENGEDCGGAAACAPEAGARRGLAALAADRRDDRRDGSGGGL